VHLRRLGSQPAQEGQRWWGPQEGAVGVRLGLGLGRGADPLASCWPSEPAYPADHADAEVIDHGVKIICADM